MNVLFTVYFRMYLIKVCIKLTMFSFQSIQGLTTFIQFTLANKLNVKIKYY